MVHMSAKTFAENCIFTKTQLKKEKEPVLWIIIKDIGEKLDIKNIFDFVNKEIKGKFGNDYLTEQQIRKYKRRGSELIEAPNLCMLMNAL